MKVAVARREFLKRAGRDLGFLGVGSVIFDSVIAKFFSTAVAQTLGQKINPSGYYVHFSMPGAPPRWYFDSLITPNGKTAANFIDGGFGTTIQKVGSEFKSIYEVQKHVLAGQTLWLPPVWNYNLAGQKFSDVLQHAVFIRGLDMEINSHQLSNARQVAPIIGGHSISGVVADDAQRPMPAIIDASSQAAIAFKSHKGFATNSISYTENATTNPISSLLLPFKDYTAGKVVHSANANQLTAQAFQEFEKLAEGRGLTSTALPEMYDAAMDLMEGKIFDMQAKWAPTVAKYRAIVKEAMQPAKGTLPGVYDKAIPTANLPQFNADNNGNRTGIMSDMRDMVTANTNAPLMAENFAVAELLLDTVTSNMVLSLRPPVGFANPSNVTSITHDQHTVGSVVSTMTTTLFYRAFLGCLTKFTGELKTKKIFDRTVIHIGSEFNRTPRQDHSGADHGFMAGNTTIISGMVKKPQVVGNIKVADLSTTYKGTFGVVADYNLDVNRPIQTNDVARTVTAMLGVSDIVTNGRALLAPVGTDWVLRKPEAKNV